MDEVQIRKDLAHWEATCADLEREVASSARRVTEINTARKGHVLPARTGDKQAQAELVRLESEAAKAERCAADDAEALRQARRKVEDLRLLLVAAKREREGARIRNLLQESAAAKLEQHAVDLVRQLDATLEQIARRNSELALELRMLDDQLGRAADSLSGAVVVVDRAPVLLYGHLRRDEVLKQFPRDAAARFQLAIKALDAVTPAGGAEKKVSA